MHPGSHPHFAAFSYFSFALAVGMPWVLLLYDSRAFKPAALLVPLAIGPAIVTVHLMQGRYDLPWIFAIFPYLGLFSILLFEFYLKRRLEDTQAILRTRLAMLACLVAMTLCISPMLRITVLLADVIDLSLVNLQAAWGLNGFEYGFKTAFERPSIGYIAITMVYVMSPVTTMLPLLYLSEARARGYFWAWVITTMLGYMLFWLVPAVGPTVASRYYPDILNPGALSAFTLPIDPYEVRNAFPSLHMTWAALLLFFSWRQSWSLALISALYFVITIFSTLGLGQHWLSDLFVALPLAALGVYLGVSARFSLLSRTLALVFAAHIFLLVYVLRVLPDLATAAPFWCGGTMLLMAALALPAGLRWAPR